MANVANFPNDSGLYAFTTTFRSDSSGFDALEYLLHGSTASLYAQTALGFTDGSGAFIPLVALDTREITADVVGVPGDGNGGGEGGGGEVGVPEPGSLALLLAGLAGLGLRRRKPTGNDFSS